MSSPGHPPSAVTRPLPKSLESVTDSSQLASGQLTIGHLVDMPGDVCSSVFLGGSLDGLFNCSYGESNLDLFCLNSIEFQKGEPWPMEEGGIPREELL